MPPEMISMGMPSSPASPMPLAAWVTPAAGTITRVPMLSLVRLTASAMKAAPHSWATSTGWMLSEALSSSYSSVLCTPGMPKVKRTPSCSRAKRASAAPVFFMSCSLLYVSCRSGVSRDPVAPESRLIAAEAAPAEKCRSLSLGDRLGRPPAVEHAVAEEGALQRAYATDAAAAEAGRLAGRVQAAQRLAVAVQHTGVQVGEHAAHALAAEQVLADGDQRPGPAIQDRLVLAGAQ